jgi:hypothetical protein
MFFSLKKGTILYRGINNLNNSNIIGNPLWLSLDKSDALLYGTIIIEYELLKDIKLLNIMDLDFHDNYINILNSIYTGTKYDGVDDRKIEASIPIGLPDYETQYNYLLLNKIKLENATKWILQHEVAVKFVKNRHRYSTFERDKKFVDTLKLIYGNICNGYISKLKWPSKFHDGFFNRELCLFNPTKELLVQRIKGGSKKTIKKKKENYDIPEGDSWNRMNITKTALTALEKEELYKNTDIKFVLENLENLLPLR